MIALFQNENTGGVHPRASTASGDWSSTPAAPQGPLSVGGEHAAEAWLVQDTDETDTPLTEETPVVALTMPNPELPSSQQFSPRPLQWMDPQRGSSAAGIGSPAPPLLPRNGASPSPVAVMSIVVTTPASATTDKTLGVNSTVTDWRMTAISKTMSLRKDGGEDPQQPAEEDAEGERDAPSRTNTG